jgi:RHS repeat-associated protein
MELWVNPRATHEIERQATSGTLGMQNQRYAIFPAFGTNNTESGAGISVGTNGISVYELANNYMPALLVWPGEVKGWTHVAVVYENKQPKPYLNGELVATGLTSPRKLVHPSASITGGYYGGFIGHTDEVRIWNRALTAEEIKANQNVYLTGAETGLVAYYPLNEGSGTILTDVSTIKAGGNKGLNNNTAWLPLSTAPLSTPDLLASYRYGFNGKEMDNEVSGTGNSYDYGFRIYNPRIAKFLSVDPLSPKYPWYTPYQFAGNKPIRFIDLDGLEEAGFERMCDWNQVSKLKNTDAERVALYNKIHFDNKDTPDKLGGKMVVGAIVATADIMLFRGWLSRALYAYEVGSAIDHSEQAAKAKQSGNTEAAEYHSKKSQDAFKGVATGIVVQVGVNTVLRAAATAEKPIAQEIQTSFKINNSAATQTAVTGSGSNFGGRTIYVDENLSPSLVDMLKASGFNAKLIAKGSQDAVFSREIIKENGILVTNNISDIGSASGFAKGTTVIGVTGQLPSRAARIQLVKSILNLAERNKINPETLSAGKVLIIKK